MSKFAAIGPALGSFFSTAAGTAVATTAATVGGQLLMSELEGGRGDLPPIPKIDPTTGSFDIVKQ